MLLRCAVAGAGGAISGMAGDAAGAAAGVGAAQRFPPHWPEPHRPPPHAEALWHCVRTHEPATIVEAINFNMILLPVLLMDAVGSPREAAPRNGRRKATRKIGVWE
jgi:hypothetical protein